MDAPKTQQPPTGIITTEPPTRQVVLKKNLPDWAKPEGEAHFVVCEDTDDKKFRAIFPEEMQNYRWVTHDMLLANKKRLGKKQKERYETFCYGFLMFYDSHVNGEHNHSIYFDWDTQDAVSIYISPKPNHLDKPKEFIQYNPMAVAATDPPTPPPPPPPAIGKEETIEQ